MTLESLEYFQSITTSAAINAKSFANFSFVYWTFSISTPTRNWTKTDSVGGLCKTVWKLYFLVWVQGPTCARFSSDEMIEVFSVFKICTSSQICWAGRFDFQEFKTVSRRNTVTGQYESRFLECKNSPVPCNSFLHIDETCLRMPFFWPSVFPRSNFRKYARFSMKNFRYIMINGENSFAVYINPDT